MAALPAGKKAGALSEKDPPPPTKAGAICGKLDTAGAVLENEAVCGNVAVTGAVEMLLLADWKEEKLLAGWKLAKEGAVLGWLLAGCGLEKEEKALLG